MLLAINVPHDGMFIIRVDENNGRYEFLGESKLVRRIEYWWSGQVIPVVDGLDLPIYFGYDGFTLLRYLLEYEEPRFKNQWRKLLPQELRDAPDFDPATYDDRPCLRFPYDII